MTVAGPWTSLVWPVHIDVEGNPFVADDDVVQGPNGKTLFLPFFLQTSNLT